MLPGSRGILTHKLPNQIHPSITGHPVPQMDPRSREFHKQREQTVQGGGSFQIGDPPPLLLGLANGTGKVISVFGQCAIGKRELARGVKATSECGLMSRCFPVLAASLVLGAEVVERLEGGPGLLVVQAVGEE